MGGLTQLIQGIILDKIIKGEPPFLPKIKIGLCLVALSGFFILVGIGFLIYAAHLWFSTQFPPEIAFALTGLVFIFVGLIISLILYKMIMIQKKMFKNFKNEIFATAQSVIELIDAELKEPVCEHPKAALILSTLMGYITGQKIL